MEEKKNKSPKPFNFGDGSLLKQTEETVVKAYERIEQKEQGGGEQPQQPIIRASEITDSAESTTQREETQNINVPIPVSLHQRLGIIKYQTKQNMKQLVVNAIREYVDRYEADNMRK